MADQQQNTAHSTLFSDRLNLYQPNSDEAAAAFSSLDYPALLGSWAVVGSTLPMWKSKKNVVISYSPIEGQPPTTFDDLVEYNAAKDPKGAKKSSVKGVDRLEQGSKAAWKWRGKGLLTPITSRWQLLGCSLSPSPSPEWAVTYFSSTLFTPAGLDIYARHGTTGLSDEQVQVIVRGLEGLGGEVAELVRDGKMFRVAQDD